MEIKKKHRYMVCKSFSMFHVLILGHIFFSCSARDTMSNDDWIRDDGETLVSAGGRFELGFFTPNGSFSERRYLGIWYYMLTPKTLVWVANREKPLDNSDGVLKIKDGNLTVLDKNGNPYWSTGLERPTSSNLTVKLMDSGNLVLYDNNELGEYLWQSFEHPTDTFLPHMKMDKNLYLIAWKDKNDPAKGNFTFKVEEEDENKFIIAKKSSVYWRSRELVEMRDAEVTYLLSNFTRAVKPTKSIYYNFTTRSSGSTFYDDTRLVINFNGQIQFLKWDKEKKTWSLQWWEPRDRCSVFNACGNFGVCNIETSKPCKCLPGFEPSLPEQWDSGDFLEGCTRRTMSCDKNSFLSLKMMKVSIESSLQVNNISETECRKECLADCRCKAYSFEEAQKSNRRGETSVNDSSCRTWLELNSLQEYENGGRNISVRVTLSDLEPSARNCQPCGTTMIPYPLSTGPDCGESNYSSFHCNSSTGRVSFGAPSGEYQVISINPEKRRFVIDTQQPKSVDNCNARNYRGTILQLNHSLPFNVTNWCYAEPKSVPVDYVSQVSPKVRTGEVEISWEPPILEPICASTANCTRLPHSTCIAAKDGKRRCLCDANFKWNGSSLNCTQVEGVHFHKPIQELEPSRPRKRLSMWIIMSTVIVGTILLASSVVSVIIWRRKTTKKQENKKADKRNRTLHTLDSQKRIKDLIDSGDLMREDDQKGIDVPFFDLESILDATDDFSGLNKLGQGGYGPVYKGKFPGGEEIAVKRLSSFSGQGLQEFKNEVVLIAKLQHRNLVRLRGFCIKEDEKILLYEYMPNRSLDSFIFDQTQKSITELGNPL